MKHCCSSPRERYSDWDIPCCPAESGELALQKAAAHPGPIHLVIADVTLPGINGYQVVDALRADRPQIKALLTSGYTAAEIRKANPCQEEVEFIGKPFRSRDLEQRVHQIFDKGENECQIES